MAALAKTCPTGATRSLLGHSLDVAHAARAMLGQGTARRRLETALGLTLTDSHLDRLGVLVGLHDVGKACVGFQDRIHGRGRGCGHTAEALAVLGAAGAIPNAVRAAMRWCLLDSWCADLGMLLYAIICHHGEPIDGPRVVACASDLTRNWSPSAGYDPVAEVASLTQALLARFPLALAAAPPLPAATRAQHALAGLTMTADWQGSDTTWHPVAGPDDRPQASLDLLTDTRWSGWHAGTPAVALLGSRTSRAAQTVALTLPLSQRLVIVEAPTGTGKTEAACLWADRLAADGLVDGLYFAVPMRSAATELHERIATMMRAVHPLLKARVVRAVPGVLDTDHLVQRWDEPSAPTWAVGGTRRVMAAPIAIGTIDQAMLSQMRIKHSHLRAWCLARQLLVVDEVHASDVYMSEIILRLVDEHLALGGYVMLMSATLGETLRARLERRPRADFAASVARPYPLVSAGSLALPVPAPPATRRVVSVTIDSHARATQQALATVAGGQPVLWIRSTVADARADAAHLRALGTPVLLHHSRYADDDRRYLDREVLAVLGPHGTRRGLIVVSTQTCEQSLDIDAELLVSDAVPADVLLQRIGRLHRHRTSTTPTTIVLDPGAWDARVTAEGKPIGAAGQGWAWVYSPLAVRETVAWLRSHGRIRVPEDVRQLVETATHADHLEQRAVAYGGRWALLWSALYGRAMRDRQTAAPILVDRALGYEHALVDGRAPTRLADGSTDVDVQGTPLRSPLHGGAISRLPVPVRWLHGVAPGSMATVISVDAVGRALLSVDGLALAYGRDGLERLTVP